MVATAAAATWLRHWSILNSWKVYEEISTILVNKDKELKYVPKWNGVKILSSCHCGPINLSEDKATSLDTCRVLKLVLITVTIVPTQSDITLSPGELCQDLISTKDKLWTPGIDIEIV